MARNKSGLDRWGVHSVGPLFLIIFQFLFIAGLNFYTFFDNDTNHTGFPLSFVGKLLGLVIAIEVIFLFKKQDTKTKAVLITSIVLGVLAVVNIIAFYKFNIMMEYDAWLKKGMP